MSALSGVLASPAVSIVIVNWNGLRLLDDCLSSVARQSFTDAETILVDNGSVDGSADWVAEHYPGVRLVRLATNEGFCGGNNAGMRVAGGRYIVLLNNDTEVETDWLAHLHAHIAADDSLAACDSKVLYFDQRELIWAAGASYSPSGAVILRGHGERDDARFDTPAEIFAAVACSAIYRREVLDQIGLLDEYFFAGYEDIDWSFRARLHGYRIENVPASRVYHKVSATHQHNSETFVYHGQRNVTAVFVKNMPGALVVRYAALHLLYMVGSLLYFARIGRLRPFLRAKAQLLRDAGRLVAMRRTTQRGRTLSGADLRQAMERDWLGPKLRKLLGAGK